jgi:hypothetical protein
MLRDSEVSVMVDCRARPGIGVWEAISGAIAFAVRNQCGVRLLWGNHLLEISPQDTPAIVQRRYDGLWRGNPQLFASPGTTRDYRGESAPIAADGP